VPILRFGYAAIQTIVFAMWKDARSGLSLWLDAEMREQYLHLSAYHCDECERPAVSGLPAVRENEISKETDNSI
jgi:hypothetical protein